MEKEVQGQCIDYLKMTGWFVIEHYKNYKPRLKGISDIEILKNGRNIWVEFKRENIPGKPKGKQSDDQKIFEYNIKSHGGEYVLIKSFYELLDYLNENIQEELKWQK